MAKLIRKKFDDIDAAVALSDIRGLKGRCEELVGDRAGELSVRLSKNYRLIFKPQHNPIPVQEDGGLDWNGVTVVTVEEVVDYH